MKPTAKVWTKYPSRFQVNFSDDSILEINPAKESLMILTDNNDSNGYVAMREAGESPVISLPLCLYSQYAYLNIKVTFSYH